MQAFKSFMHSPNHHDSSIVQVLLVGVLLSLISCQLETKTTQCSTGLRCPTSLVCSDDGTRCVGPGGDFDASLPAPPIDAALSTIYDASYDAGVLDASVTACDFCHGGGGESAPPRDLAGNEGRASRGVGAHREHVGVSERARPVECQSCHTSVIEVSDPAHLDGDDRAEVNFGDLAGGAAEYDASSGTCINVYCHSDGGATFVSMVWTDEIELQCASCHDDGSRNGASELSGEHRSHIEDGYTCNDCHDAVIDRDDDFKNQALHVNGVFDVELERGGDYNQGTKDCSGAVCHDEDALALPGIINWFPDGERSLLAPRDAEEQVRHTGAATIGRDLAGGLGTDDQRLGKVANNPHANLPKHAKGER